MNPHTLALVEKAKAAAEQRRLAALQATAKSLEQSSIGFSAMTVTAPSAPVTLANKQIAGNTGAAGYKPVFAHLPQFASNITLNDEQLMAKDLALQGKSFCLIGAAGTGKTTVTQDIIASLQRCSHVRPIGDNTKWLTKNTPGILVVGYTNKAVNNIRKKLPDYLQPHCITIHKTIEFGPVWYDVETDDGGTRTTMRFEPARNAVNPLPYISTIIIEESSMVGTELFDQLMDALPGNPQLIILGDLNQLPPVFGPSILGFKLGELPVVELKTVYRQALLSPIISLATAIRTNNAAGFSNTGIAHKAITKHLGTDIHVEDADEHGKVTVHTWKKRLHEKTAIGTIIAFMTRQYDQGLYKPDEDMILCPFNKSFGTIEINAGIADHISKKNDKEVHEVIARYKRSYWAVGDKVLVDRHEGIITKISVQPGYIGKVPRPASKSLKRDGSDSESGFVNPTADEILNELNGYNGGDAGDEEGAANKASHVITVYIADLDSTKELTTAGEINSMLLAYCLTVHKSQGSEWPKVYVLLHSTHARGPALSRELLYTAVTRAKQELYIVCEGDIKPYDNSISLAAGRPVIPGTTLTEKIEYFNSKRSAMGRDFQ